MNRVIPVVILLGAMLPGLLLIGEDKPEPDPTAKLMKQKLAASSEILPALAEEDYEKLSRSADQLLKLTREQWTANETPEYRAQLKDFWIVVEGIKSSAEKKNLDGATLGYVQMTISCVRCHEYVRKQVP